MESASFLQTAKVVAQVPFRQTEASVHRYSELDGLRGVCALIVVFWHVALAWQPVTAAVFNGATPAGPAALLLRTPAVLALSGIQAVLIFFVLSGFVLALTLEKSDHWTYRPFIIKRVARIYLPFAVAILCAYGLSLLLRARSMAGASEWLAGLWNAPATPLMLAKHLLMTGTDNSLDGVVWSLVHEMRLSVVFPFVAWGVRRKPRIALPLGVAISLLALSASAQVRTWELETATQTFSYLYLFAFGAALYFGVARVKGLVGGLPRAATGALWFLCLGAIVVTFQLDPLQSERVLQPICGAAAVGLVGLTLSTPSVRRWLSSAIPTFLGKISYSLYLIHLPVILAAAHLGGGSFFAPIIPSSAAMLSIGLAWVFHRGVEQPAQGFGRRLAARWRSSKSPTV